MLFCGGGRKAGRGFFFPPHLKWKQDKRESCTPHKENWKSGRGVFEKVAPLKVKNTGRAIMCVRKNRWGDSMSVRSAGSPPPVTGVLPLSQKRWAHPPNSPPKGKTQKEVNNVKQMLRAGREYGRWWGGNTRLFRGWWTKYRGQCFEGPATA